MGLGLLKRKNHITSHGTFPEQKMDGMVPNKYISRPRDPARTDPKRLI